MSYAERFRPPRSKRAGTGAVLPEAYAAGMPSVGLRIAISSFLVNFVRARGKVLAMVLTVQGRKK